MSDLVEALAQYVSSVGWKSLPIAVYVVKASGEFVDGNQKLRDLLSIPTSELQRHNIESFYLRQSDRRALLDAADSKRNIERQTVPFLVNGHLIQVQVFCHAVRDEGDAHGAVLGYVGALLEVPAESDSHHVVDRHLPHGTYALDANDRIIRASEGLAKLHGYAKSDELLGLDIADFYERRDDVHGLKHRLIAQGGLLREPVRLKRRDGHSFSAYVTAIPYWQENEYAGRGGMVEDRTIEIETEALLDDIPVGLYSLDCRDGQDIVVTCNRAFAEIHDYPSREAILGADIRRSHADPEESSQFLLDVERAAAKRQAVSGAKLHIRTPKGRTKLVEVNSRAKLIDGRVVGRTGAIRDITEEEKLRAELSSLNTIAAITNDVDAVLHMFRQTLMHLNLSVRAVESVLAGAAQAEEPVPTDAEVEEEILGPLRAMLGGLPALLGAMRVASAPTADTDRLAELGTMLDAYPAIPAPHRRDLWLDGVVEITDIVNKTAPHVIARSTYRPVIAAANVVARIAGLATLRIARDAILAVDAPVVSLREFVTSGTREPEPRHLLKLDDVVRESIRNLTAFAHARRVRIEFHGKNDVSVLAARGELTRAVRNLIDNAIKYSWQRDDRSTWIEVRVSSDISTAVVAVEDWGVPIPADEISRQLSFRLGYRGRLSSDRGRGGTGVGLPDARRIARAHGGDVELESRPARPDGDASNYNQPFLTTVSLRLPLTSDRRRSSR